MRSTPRIITIGASVLCCFCPIYRRGLPHFFIVLMSFVGRKRARFSFKNLAPKDGTVPVSAAKAQVSLAKKVAKLQKVVRGIAPEVKFFSANSIFSNVSDTVGSVAGQLTIAAGTDLFDRISDRIRIKAIRLQTRVDTSTASLGTNPTNGEFTRFLLVQDTQQVSDTVPSAGVIVRSTSTPQFPEPSLDNNGRFKWLWVSPLIHHSRIADSKAVAALTTPMTPSQSPCSYFTKTRCDIPVIFNGTASTDIQKNGLYVVCLTNLAADTLDADANIRVDFIDD